MIKGTIHQEDIALRKIYAPNLGIPKFMKQLLTDLRGRTDKDTVIVGNLNIHVQQ